MNTVSSEVTRLKKASTSFPAASPFLSRSDLRRFFRFLRRVAGPRPGPLSYSLASALDGIARYGIGWVHENLRSPFSLVRASSSLSRAVLSVLTALSLTCTQDWWSGAKARRALIAISASVMKCNPTCM